MKLNKLEFAGVFIIIITIIFTLGGCNNNSGNQENLDAISEFQVLVLDENKNKVKEAKVTLSDQKKTTNSKGIATFENISTGSQTLKVEHPGYKYSENILVNKEQTPYTAQLQIAFELNSIPDNITSENNLQAQTTFPFDFWPTQTAKAWVAEEDSYEMLKHVILRSVVFNNNILINQLDKWIEMKMENIVNWEKGNIELSKVVDLEKEEIGSIKSKLKSKGGEKVAVNSTLYLSTPVINNSEYEVNLTNNITHDYYDNIYDRKYEFSDNKGSRGILFVNENNTRVNFFDMTNNFGYQVIHDEIKNFTIILTSNTLVMIQKEDDDLIYKYLQIEDLENVDDYDSNPHFAKMYGYEKNGNMTAGIYYKAREIHNFSDFKFTNDFTMEEIEKRIF